ncbi:MAG: SufS family cysteine desulfurase [Actinomycetaceae bacterium]|nr:SufS family cysteine desulfurase [Actinomycetaceae bacterium]
MYSGTDGHELTDAMVVRLREDFPILSRVGRGGQEIAYLDASATTQKPLQVINAERDFYTRHNAAVNRGTHVLGDEATQIYDDGRGRLARFLGVRDSQEIIWTRNATEAINLLTYALLNAYLDGHRGITDERLKLGAGDRVVVTRAEHHANLVPWQQLCARVGAELAWLDLDPQGRIDLGTLDAITPNTKIVAFTHMSNVTGALSPVEHILGAARSMGALTVLDTCQSAAHIPVNLGELGVDFAAFSGHKMLGPTGIGALWGRYDLLAQLPPFMTGGSMVQTVSMEATTFVPAPARFEAGSQAVAQIAGWCAALDYMDNIGMAHIRDREEELAQQLLDGLSTIEGIRILGPREAKDRACVVSFAVEGVHPHDVGQFLDARDIAIRVGHHCAQPIHQHFGVPSSCRVSACITTTKDEIERLIDALAQTRSFFSLRG